MPDWSDNSHAVYVDRKQDIPKLYNFLNILKRASSPEVQAIFDVDKTHEDDIWFGYIVLVLGKKIKLDPKHTTRLTYLDKNVFPWVSEYSTGRRKFEDGLALRGWIKGGSLIQPDITHKNPYILFETRNAYDTDIDFWKELNIFDKLGLSCVSKCEYNLYGTYINSDVKGLFFKDRFKLIIEDLRNEALGRADNPFINNTNCLALTEDYINEDFESEKAMDAFVNKITNGCFKSVYGLANKYPHSVSIDTYASEE